MEFIIGAVCLLVGFVLGRIVERIKTEMVLAEFEDDLKMVEDYIERVRKHEQKSRNEKTDKKV